MADNTPIEWTDATWTPIRARNLKTGKTGWHCEHVSPGCEHCYAEVLNKRLGTGLAFKPGHRKDVEIFLDEKMLTQPLRWKKPRKIFLNSMTDTFADFVPDEWIDKIFAVMALAPQHIFQVLTKRPQRMREYLSRALIGGHIVFTSAKIDPAHIGATHGQWPLPNVWLGTSVEDQTRADERIPHLLATPAAVRWISAEPLLGQVDLANIPMPYWGDEVTVPRPAIISSLTGAIGQGGIGVSNGKTVLRTAPFEKLDWIVAGGESQHGSRPSHPDWFRTLRDQCATADVPFLFKQWGDWVPQVGAVDGWNLDDNPEASKYFHRDWEDDHWGEPYKPMWCDDLEDDTVSHIGKGKSGRLLDGVEHNGFPAFAKATARQAPPTPLGSVPASSPLQSAAAEGSKE